MKPLTAADTPNTEIPELRTPRRHDLPVADWHHIHDAALELHQAPTISHALVILAEFVENFRIGDHLRAVVSDLDGESILLMPLAETRGARGARNEGYRASFDIQVRERQSLRISLALPIAKTVREQVKLEMLLEHFSVAAQRLPVE